MLVIISLSGSRIFDTSHTSNASMHLSYAEFLHVVHSRAEGYYAVLLCANDVIGFQLQEALSYKQSSFILSFNYSAASMRFARAIILSYTSLSCHYTLVTCEIKMLYRPKCSVCHFMCNVERRRRCCSWNRFSCTLIITQKDFVAIFMLCLHLFPYFRRKINYSEIWIQSFIHECALVGEAMMKCKKLNWVYETPHLGLCFYHILKLTCTIIILKNTL